MTLAEFSDPPLIEVVTGVQFKKLDTLTAARAGAFWQRLKDEFPETQDQPPLPSVSERFDKQPRTISFQVFQQSATPRIWLLDSTGSKLIQVQSDRFIFNWRQTDKKIKYPRFNEINGNFFSYFNNFASFIKDELNEEILPELCELTYINHIFAGPGWAEHTQIEDVFNVSFPSLDSGDLDFEEGRFSLVHRLPKRNGQDIGRLRINIEPRLALSTGAPMFVLEIGARGYAWNKSSQGIQEFFDLAHREIVPAFESITTQQMHHIWGKEDVART